MDINRLTLYSHGAGCGCKLSPSELSALLAGVPKQAVFPALLVGNEENDDAAVFDLGDGTALISTTDFFMPIVDDPFDFGRIAAVNALSDIYAMGGSPLMAIALLGWPSKQLSLELASQVVQGAQEICASVGIPLGGGHSIETLEPFFGLAVTGRIPIAHIKRNSGAQAGDLLYLTKAIGTGILSTAQKLERLKPEDAHIARDSMVIINQLGQTMGSLPYVHAMTDVTGFGLIGHLYEMCSASGVGAEIHVEKVPVLGNNRLDWYLKMQCAPAATLRNWQTYASHCQEIDATTRDLLCDPQTSGGLLIAIDPAYQQTFESICQVNAQTPVIAIGYCTPIGDPVIRIQT